MADDDDRVSKAGLNTEHGAAHKTAALWARERGCVEVLVLVLLVEGKVAEEQETRRINGHSSAGLLDED